MRRIIIILLMVLSLDFCQGQLNYEGSPLTENTEYTAEESHYSERDDRQSKGFIQPPTKPLDSYVAAANSLGHHNEDLTKPAYPTMDIGLINVQAKDASSNVGASSTPIGLSNANSPSPSDPITNMQIVQPREEHQSLYQSDNTNEAQLLPQHIPSSMSNNALDNFLNSQTPEESQYALDNYLRSHAQAAVQSAGYLEPSRMNNQNVFERANHHQQSIIPVDNVSNLQSVTGSAIIPSAQALEPQYYQVTRPLPSSAWPDAQMSFQNRRDFIPGPRRRPFYHYQGPAGRFRARPRVQHRIGHGYFGKGPPVPYRESPKPTVEVIYTRPPGFSHGSPPISNPPVPYEDAGAFFPDSDHPPVSNDVYYSQLYAQSYDPHYYNHIAKTGKIKPWLYGKLGHHEHSGFWGELYHSFKKHGMKNMMNPMFLLGLSIPALTLMLSAIVQKRSLGRSDSGFVGDYSLSEEKINEIAAKVREAIECYEKNSIGNTIKCWKS